MTLTADSGSTKCDWLLEENGREVARCQTEGMSPVHQSADELRRVVEEQLKPLLGDKAGAIAELHFYGSGCTAALSPVVDDVLRASFAGCGLIEVASDMLGAARILCGDKEGIACILGTGANSCLYDGKHIVSQTPALGYVLGDEGSGAVLGKLLVGALYKDGRFVGVRKQFEEETQLTLGDVIERVYRQPLANRWLASLSHFVARHIDNPLLDALVVENFRRFFARNILPYQRLDLPVGFVGSMAFHYRRQLAEAASAEGFSVGRVMKGMLSETPDNHAVT